MEAKGLMIGDWVRNDLNQVEKVFELRETQAMLSYNDLYDYDDLEPIPLTGEILEKNRFEKQDDGWYKITLEEENLIGVQPFENVNWIFGANVFPNIIEHLNILYVHELQHALRLCGVEKEINL